MRLDRVQGTNFRCVDDSTEFKISDVTCLVGKNESGKTTLLQAIERLSPQNPAHAEYDRTRDYPRRHLTDYDERHKDGAARVVRSVWSLTDDEVAELEGNFGQGCLTSREVVVDKRYEPNTAWNLPLDEPHVLKHLAQQAGCTPEEAGPLGEFKSVRTLCDYIANLGDGASANLRALQDRLARFPDQNLQRAAYDGPNTEDYVLLKLRSHERRCLNRQAQGAHRDRYGQRR
jgi:hypothetical protein